MAGTFCQYSTSIFPKSNVTTQTHTHIRTYRIKGLKGIFNVDKDQLLLLAVVGLGTAGSAMQWSEVCLVFKKFFFKQIKLYNPATKQRGPQTIIKLTQLLPSICLCLWIRQCRCIGDTRQQNRYFCEIIFSIDNQMSSQRQWQHI